MSFSPLILRRIVFVVPPKITRLFDRPVFLTTPSSTPSSCLMYSVWRRFVGREMETRNQRRWTRRCSMHQVQTSLLSYPLIAECRPSLPLARTLAMFFSSVDALDLLADGGV